MRLQWQRWQQLRQQEQQLLKQLPVHADIFMTHSHWDHIQGLPFFTPLYIPGNSVRIHGAFDVVSGRGIDADFRDLPVCAEDFHFPGGFAVFLFKLRLDDGAGHRRAAHQ